jgi:hypothetical protein
MKTFSILFKIKLFENFSRMTKSIDYQIEAVHLSKQQKVFGKKVFLENEHL